MTHDEMEAFLTYLLDNGYNRNDYKQYPIESSYNAQAKDGKKWSLPKDPEDLVEMIRGYFIDNNLIDVDI